MVRKSPQCRELFCRETITLNHQNSATCNAPGQSADNPQLTVDHNSAVDALAQFLLWRAGRRPNDPTAAIALLSRHSLGKGLDRPHRLVFLEKRPGPNDQRFTIWREFTWSPAPLIERTLDHAIACAEDLADCFFDDLKIVPSVTSLVTRPIRISDPGVRAQFYASSPSERVPA